MKNLRKRTHSNASERARDDPSGVSASEPVPIQIQRGLDLRLGGAPDQRIDADSKIVSTVAIVFDDFPGQRFTGLVKPGESVRLAQPLAVDRDRPRIQHTSPGTGIVREIIHGDRHRLHAIVVELSGDGEEDRGLPPQFETIPESRLSDLGVAEVTARLLESGLWTALRTRPFDRIPDPDVVPRSIFVTAMDTAPFAPSAEVIIAENSAAFVAGLRVISCITSGTVFVCRSPGSTIPTPDVPRVRVAEFAGPHPAGLVGTHIHFLDPVGPGEMVWHLQHQDLIAIGELFVTGRVSVQRIASLAGPRVERPRLLRTRLGANTDQLVSGELSSGACRILSGSVLAGRQASGWGRFLGRYHSQVCALEEIEGPRRGQRPLSRFSTRAIPELHGRSTAFYPTEVFERVFPLHLLVAPLLRSLIVGSTEVAQALGCLELVEEDLALCTYVCPGKQEYAPLLRAALDQIESSR